MLYTYLTPAQDTVGLFSFAAQLYEESLASDSTPQQMVHCACGQTSLCDTLFNLFV